MSSCRRALKLIVIDKIVQHVFKDNDFQKILFCQVLRNLIDVRILTIFGFGLYRFENQHIPKTFLLNRLLLYQLQLVDYLFYHFDKKISF